MKKLTFAMIMLLFVSLAAACGSKNAEEGKAGITLEPIGEEDIKEDDTIIGINEGGGYYRLSLEKDSSCIYFYAVAYDEDGELAEKSVLTTLPTGMEAGSSYILNAFFPELEYPGYAIGVALDEVTEYYLVENKKGDIKLSYIPLEEFVPPVDVPTEIEDIEEGTEAVFDTEGEDTEEAVPNETEYEDDAKESVNGTDIQLPD